MEDARKLELNKWYCDNFTDYNTEYNTYFYPVSYNDFLDIYTGIRFTKIYYNDSTARTTIDEGVELFDFEYVNFKPCHNAESMFDKFVKEYKDKLFNTTDNETDRTDSRDLESD